MKRFPFKPSNASEIPIKNGIIPLPKDFMKRNTPNITKEIPTTNGIGLLFSYHLFFYNNKNNSYIVKMFQRSMNKTVNAFKKTLPTIKKLFDNQES